MKHCLRPHKAGFIEPWTSAGSIVTGDKIGRADWDGSENDETLGISSFVSHDGIIRSTGQFGHYDSPTIEDRWGDPVI